jgi:hypothetical protein
MTQFSSLGLMGGWIRYWLLYLNILVKDDHFFRMMENNNDNNALPVHAIDNIQYNYFTLCEIVSSRALQLYELSLRALQLYELFLRALQLYELLFLRALQLYELLFLRALLVSLQGGLSVLKQVWRFQALAYSFSFQ